MKVRFLKIICDGVQTNLSRDHDKYAPQSWSLMLGGWLY